MTRDTVLTADLSGCAGNGLVLGADGITLDLNGHTISGTTTFGDVAGIRVTGRRDVHVTGSGGPVRHFDTGVLLKNTVDSQVDQVTVLHNRVGVGVAGRSADTIFEVTARQNLDAALELSGDRHLAISNTATDNPDGAGIHLVRPTTEVRILGNDTSRNGFMGVFIEGADRDIVMSNRMVGAAMGVVSFGGTDTRISHNRVSGGPHRATDTGISVSGGTGNVIDHDVVDRTARDGIAVATVKAPTAIDTVVRRNVVLLAGRDSFAVQSEGSRAVRGTRLSGNRAERSGDDGFDIRAPATMVRRNVARSNSDFGIVAVRGVTDGGHNTASGNGNPAQCRNVRCH